MTPVMYSIQVRLTNIVGRLPSMPVKTKTPIPLIGGVRILGDPLGLYRHRKKKAWSYYIGVSVPSWLWVDQFLERRHDQVHSLSEDFRSETPTIGLAQRS